MVLPKVTKRKCIWRYMWNKWKKRDAMNRASACGGEDGGYGGGGSGGPWAVKHTKENTQKCIPQNWQLSLHFFISPKLPTSHCVAVTSLTTALKQEVPITGSFRVESVKFSAWECGLWCHKTPLWVPAPPLTHHVALIKWPKLSPLAWKVRSRGWGTWHPLPAVCWVLIVRTHRICSLPGT